MKAIPNMYRDVALAVLAVLILMMLLSISSSLKSIAAAGRKTEKRIEFLMGIAADYDREIQHEKYMNGELSRYELYYARGNVWEGDFK